MVNFLSVTSIPVIGSSILIFYFILNYIFQAPDQYNTLKVCGRNIKTINTDLIVSTILYLFGYGLGFFNKDTSQYINFNTAGFSIITFSLIVYFFRRKIFIEDLHKKEKKKIMIFIVINIVIAIFLVIPRKITGYQALAYFIIYLTTIFNCIDKKIINEIKFFQTNLLITIFPMMYGTICGFILKSIKNTESSLVSFFILFPLSSIFLVIFLGIYYRKKERFSQIIIFNNNNVIWGYIVSETNEDIIIEIETEYIQNYGINTKIHRYRKSDIFCIIENN